MRVRQENCLVLQWPGSDFVVPFTICWFLVPINMVWAPPVTPILPSSACLQGYYDQQVTGSQAQLVYMLATGTNP